MVANELACEISDAYVNATTRILDPFCGSGRLLATAKQARSRVGIDVNPLAWLITSAKLASPNIGVLQEFIKKLDDARSCIKVVEAVDLHRRVEWFSPRINTELCEIVAWINDADLGRDELVVVAVALSATVREVSYARQSGWKLHRITESDRSAFTANPWIRFRKRLEYCVKEIGMSSLLKGENCLYLGTAADHLSKLNSASEPFDLVVTSPPYGDSKTTVQYGAASALCLSFVSKLNGLHELGRSGSTIDNHCLGGVGRNLLPESELERYWDGTASSDFGHRVSRFLSDYAEVCSLISSSLVAGGRAVFIVGRRSTGGSELRLDEFTKNRFSIDGFVVESQRNRSLASKRVPRHINRFARSKSEKIRSEGVVATMAFETVLVMRKSR